MRRLTDALILLLVLGVAGGVVHHRRSLAAADVTGEGVKAALTRLYERASYYGALEHSMRETGTPFPLAIDPEWFGSRLPVNTLLGGEHPWLDVAPPGDDAAHPPDPVATRPGQAGFWYNPARGVFRARVSPHLGDDEALALYNELNGTGLTELRRDADPARRPLVYLPGETSAASLAAPFYRPALEAKGAAPGPLEPEPEDIFFYNPDSAWERQFREPVEEPAADPGGGRRPRLTSPRR